MEFDYRDYFRVENRTGYETLLYHAMTGDSSLINRADMIEAAIQPILNVFAAGRGGELHPCAAGSEGPTAADEMVRRDGHTGRAL